MSVTSVRLQPELEKSLDEVAGKLQRSRNWVINQAIKEFLSKENLQERRWHDTLQALDSLNKGHIIDGTEVHSWLQSWGTESESEKPNK